MVSEIQGERVLSEVVLTDFCDSDDLVKNVIESQSVVESVV